MLDAVTRRIGIVLQHTLRAAFPKIRRFYYRIANEYGFGDLYTHEVMLADKVRIDTYHEAIDKYVQKGDRVIDLGTGSGILAFFAAEKGADPVYAIDHSRIIDVARRVAEANGISNVEFRKTSSHSFTLHEKVDVIIQEQIGHALFDERMVSSVADMRERLLKPGGQILPAYFELYIDPVQLRNEHAVPFAWQQTVHGISFSSLEKLKDSMTPEYFWKLRAQRDFDHFLCDSAPILSVDLSSTSEQELRHVTFEYTREVKHPGRLDGFCVHFTVRFDDALSFSTSPFAPKTCWQVPLLRVMARWYDAGETVHFKFRAPDLENVRTWRWTVDGSAP